MQTDNHYVNYALETSLSRDVEQKLVWSYANAFGGAKAVVFKIKDAVVLETPTIPATFR